MRRRLILLFSLVLLTSATLVHTGCAPGAVMPFTAEVDDPDYKRGKELLRMGREQQAMETFLRLIDQRGGAAAESHLEVAILYHKHIKDPIAAIYHYRRYRELRPTTDQARLVLQSIEACIRDFARTLPAQPMDNQVERTDLLDAVDRLQRENLQLKEQLAGARAAVLDAKPLAAAPEPSQGFVSDWPGNNTAGRTAPPPEYSTPVGVVPIEPMDAANATLPARAATPSPSIGPGAPTPTIDPDTPALTASGRKHTVAKGDTLMSISLRHFGTRSRWKEIYQLNRDQLPSEGALQIGMELKLPR